MDIMIACYKRDGGGYVPHEKVRKITDQAMTPRQFAGFCGGLKRKGWIFKFEAVCADIEITCMALMEYGLTSKGFCNSEDCFCQVKNHRP